MPRNTRAIERTSMAQQVYDDLRQQILTGELAEGGRLPSEPESATTYKVSRATVREAYSRLQQEGIVEARQGSGRFVLPGAATLTQASANLIRSTRELLRSRGFTCQIAILDVHARPPQPDEAQFFRQTAADQVIEVERAYVADGAVLAYSANVVALDAYPDWKAVDWTGSWMQILQDHGQSVHSLVVDAAAVNLPEHIRSRYDASASQPWLRTRGAHHDQRHRPVYWSNEYMRGDLRTVRIVNSV